jgi:hypothetical protein
MEGQGLIRRDPRQGNDEDEGALVKRLIVEAEFGAMLRKFQR